MTRIHANDGNLIAEFARERRIYVPFNAIPDRVVEAFISAEDKNFYQHGGLDIQGILRAAVTNMSSAQSGRRMVGASTITQQVAKNFLLSSDQTDRAQAERGDPRHPHRARLHQGADPRALSERDLSRRRRLWRGRRGADLLGQVAERAVARRLRLSRDAAQGAEQLQSVPLSRARRRAPQLGDRPHGRERLRHQGGGRDRQGRAARRAGAPDRREARRVGILRRGSAPRHHRSLRRGQALWRRPLRAHDARPARCRRSPARLWSTASSPTITVTAGAGR